MDIVSPKLHIPTHLDGGPPQFFRNKLPYVNPSFQRPLKLKKPVFLGIPLFFAVFNYKKYIDALESACPKFAIL